MTDQQIPQLRLRVFAGPNGSGKSTVIKAIRETRVQENIKLDIGTYINADDIAQCLSISAFSFKEYGIKCTTTELLTFARSSGLLSEEFREDAFSNSFNIEGDRLNITNATNLNRLAQLIARYLRHAMIATKKRFSFETVFSHESNLEDMRKAARAGYKVYLYFVGTESPAINEYRVQLRVREGGHDVPADRIWARYKRSMELLYDAAEIAYQAFFFDNSINDVPYKLVGHFKKSGDHKQWDDIDQEEISLWFKKYYLAKTDKPQS